MTAMQELVVPRSIPITLLIFSSPLSIWNQSFHPAPEEAQLPPKTEKASDQDIFRQITRDRVPSIIGEHLIKGKHSSGYVNNKNMIFLGILL
jgi:hypothetical protein